MTLRSQLLLFASFCAVIPIFLTIYWTSRVVDKRFQLELENRSLEILVQANGLIKKKIDLASSYSFLVISNPALPLALKNNNLQILSYVSGSIKKGLDLDLFEVIDGAGKVVYSAEHPEQAGLSRLSTPFIRQLYLDYQLKHLVSIVGAEKRGSDLSIQVATLLPGTNLGTIPSAIVMGFYLNDSFLKEFQTIYHAQFALFSNNEIFAGTFPNKGQFYKVIQSWPDKMWNELKQNKKIVSRIEWEELSGVGSYMKMNLEAGEFYLGALLSKKGMVSTQKKTQFYIFIAGFVGILVTIFLAIFLSRRILAPLANVTRAVDEVAKGNLKAQAQVNSRDEIGFFAYSFNTMVWQLREAQEKLVRSERLAAIGELASGVGHELRNPLAAIKNALYFIKSEIKKGSPVKGNEQIEKMISLADGEIEATVKISNDLLEFSRAIRVTPQEVEINALIGSVLNVTSIPAGIAVNKKLGKSLPMVSVDPERIRQVLINLINNAIESMPEGGTLEIETCYNRKDAHEGQLELYVRDSGCGIAEENQEKIFEPLFSTKAKGSGLGLAVVRGIVESHRGEIALKSAVGKGTEFVVKIPVHGMRDKG